MKDVNKNLCSSSMFRESRLELIGSPEELELPEQQPELTNVVYPLTGQ